MIPYTIILIAVLIISPFAFKIAEKQDKKTKSRLKNIFLLLLVAQTVLALSNWKALILFLGVTLVQIFLLTKKASAKTLTAILNFINTFVFFFIMIRLDQRQISDSTNLAAIAIAFIILIGNVVSLLFINKEKRLHLEPLSRRGKLVFSSILFLIIAAILWLSSQSKDSRAAVIVRVSSLPEVKEYLRAVPSGQVVIDHEDKEKNSYLIHVYEVKDGHTATFNWYEVNKKTGEITTDF